MPVQGISTKPVSFGEHGYGSSATSLRSATGVVNNDFRTVLLSHKPQNRTLPYAPKRDGAVVKKYFCNDTEPKITPRHGIVKKSSCNDSEPKHAQLHAAVRTGSCSGNEPKIAQIHGAVKRVPCIDDQLMIAQLHTATKKGSCNDSQPKIAQLHGAVKLCTCSDSERTIAQLHNRKTTPRSSGGGDQHGYHAPSGRVTDWSVARVSQWLLALGMKKFCNFFAKSKINGLKLLQLDSDQLRALGMTSGSDRSLFRRKLKRLKNRKHSSETKSFEERLKKKAKKTGKKK